MKPVISKFMVLLYSFLRMCAIRKIENSVSPLRSTNFVSKALSQKLLTSCERTVSVLIINEALFMITVFDW